MEIPFLIRGDDGNELGDAYIVVISEPVYSPRSWGEQLHFQECHPEIFDKDIGIEPFRAEPDEYTAKPQKYVFETEEEAFHFMKSWWDKVTVASIL